MDTTTTGPSVAHGLATALPARDTAADHSVGPGRTRPLARHHALLRLAEEAITVADIVSDDLWRADPHACAGDVALEMAALGFDVAPLDEEPAHRYIRREELAGTAPVGDVARTIGVGTVVSATLPLAEVIPLLGTRPWLFVLDRDRVSGMVTRADLQRPPVSMLVLGLIVSTEAGLDLLIEQHRGSDWRACLTEDRLAKAERIVEERRRHNAEISLLRCVQIADRFRIACKTPAIRRDLGMSGKELKQCSARLQQLRDTLAHAGGLLDAIPDPIAAVVAVDDVRRFADTVWDAVERLDGLWDEFVDTDIVRIDTATEMPLSGPSSHGLPHGSPMFVLSASNAGGRRDGDDANDRAHAQLQADLAAISAWWCPAIGRSRSSDWAERSFLVAKIDRATAVELGRRYDQVAVFELTDDEVRVVNCADHQVRTRRPRHA